MSEVLSFQLKQNKKIIFTKSYQTATFCSVFSVKIVNALLHLSHDLDSALSRKLSVLKKNNL